VAVDSTGNVYVADTNNNRIRKITPAGLVTTLAGSTSGFADGNGIAAKFSYPNGLAVDSIGNVYVADSGNNKIRKITPDGVVSTLAGSGLRGSEDGIVTAASFNSPNGVALDSKGNIYVADINNKKIRKIT
jgi:sugar lactone lactonase YvrE